MENKMLIKTQVKVLLERKASRRPKLQNIGEDRQRKENKIEELLQAINIHQTLLQMLEDM